MTEVIHAYRAIEQDKKWSGCLAIMHAMRALIVQNADWDCSNALVDFDVLCSLADSFTDNAGAKVYLARDKVTHAFVVAKEYTHNDNAWDLPHPVLRQLYCSARFLESAKTNAAHQSTLASVQQILDVSIEKNLTFVVFRYYPVVMNTIFHSKLHHDPSFIVETIDDLVLAVAAVHRAGVAHRDIKFENICFDETSRIVLIDFDSGTQTVRQHLKKTLPVCTLFTRAPEQFIDVIRESKTNCYDAFAGDWWAVGCVIAQMLSTGQYLFDVTFDGYEHDFVAKIRQFCAEFDRCYKNNIRSSPNARVKHLMRTCTSRPLLTLLHGLLSLDPTLRAKAAHAYIDELLVHTKQ